MKLPKIPQTPQEWQEAVNAAEAGLLLDSCYQYGLMTGPPINVARCEYLLQRGAELGYFPAKDTGALLDSFLGRVS